MSKSSETICQGCSSRKRCADGMEPVEGGLAGPKLVAMAAGYFLAPLVAAIAAAVLTDGRPFQVVASAGAFIAVVATAVAVGALARRRSNR